MSQYDFGTIDPETKSGTQLSSDLNNWRNALHSAHKGASAPAYASAGTLWLDDTTSSAWKLNVYDGTDWIPIVTVDSTNNTVNLGKLDGASQWTKQQYYSAGSLTDGANIAWNLDDKPSVKVTLAGNRTLDNPTNMKDGMTYMLKVVQDATGSRTLTYGTAYDWTALGSTTPTLSTAANAEDLLVFYSDGIKMYGINNANIKG
jgi:hypothetical protein